MFLTAWFGLDQPPGAGRAGAARATSENAWHALPLLRWLMLLTVLLALASVALHLSQRSLTVRTDTGLAVGGAGLALALLLLYRVLIDLPSADRIVDQKLGAILGLMASFGIALGGYGLWRHERALRARRLASGRISR